MKTFLTFLFFAAAFGSAIAQQAGTLDNSFNTDGRVTTHVVSSNSLAKAVAIQQDGRIIIAGSASGGNLNDFALARYLSDGSPDSSFNGTGIQSTDFNQVGDFANGIVINNVNGKIVAGGYTENGNGFDFALASYNPDGTPDNVFGTGGKVITSFGTVAFGNAVALQADGKILLSGYSLQTFGNQFSIARYNVDGSLDSTFNTNGKVTTQVGQGSAVATCMVIQPDGKILVAGKSFNDSTFLSEFAIVRYNTNGTPDNSFNGNGIVLTPGLSSSLSINAISLQTDGKIVVGGYSGNSPSSNNFTLARYQIDGTPDSTFGINSMLVSPFGSLNDEITSLLVQQDGKIIAGGYAVNGNSDEFAIARYDATGNPDISFGTGGKSSTVFGGNDGIYAMAMQADGKIVAAGTAFINGGFDFAIARYHGDLNTGISNADFSESNLITYPNPVTDHVILTYLLEKPETVSIQLVDVNGRLITNLFNRTQTAGKQLQRISIPASLKTGTYYIRLSTSGGISTAKFVK